MKIGIIGSRSISDYHRVETTIRHSPWVAHSSPANWNISLVSGGADGVDSCAEQFADKYDIPIEVKDPDWNNWSHGHPALVRNTEIVKEADAVIAVWDGNSSGTRDTMEKCMDHATPLYYEVV